MLAFFLVIGSMLMLSILIKVPTFQNLFDNFHCKLVTYYQEDKDAIYDPDKMKEFSDRYAPGLFDQLLEIITSKDHHAVKNNQRRKSLQMTRVTALLHMLYFFRNQVYLFENNH